MCNYFKEFGRCKFTTYCKYDHTKQNNIKSSDEKLRKVEKDIEELRNMKEVINLGKSDMEEQLSEKILALKKKIDLLLMLWKRKIPLFHHLKEN